MIGQLTVISLYYYYRLFLTCVNPKHAQLYNVKWIKNYFKVKNLFVIYDHT